MPLLPTLRWFGPNDPIRLEELRQAGAQGIVSALHQIPYGEEWTEDAIRQRREMIEAQAMTWSVAESVPVSEAIKTRQGPFQDHLENYRRSLVALGRQGVRIVCYNFMPVLDWVRTDLHRVLPDGSVTLHYDPVAFAAFDLFLLKRPGAEAEYSGDQLQAAERWFRTTHQSDRERLQETIIDIFPGCAKGTRIEDIRAMLARYDGFTRERLRENLAQFLREVVPVAEENEVRLAIHPDDPPFSVLGLPRIVSTESDLQAILEMESSPANGLTFCTGSLGIRREHDLPGMIRRLGPRIHFAHLRSSRVAEDGSFHEAGHLDGDVDMPAVVAALVRELRGRRRSGSGDPAIPFRPDHGNRILDDLNRPDSVTPGYPLYGRLKGLAELRGLILGAWHYLES